MLDFIGTMISLLGTYFFTQANIKMWPAYITAGILNSLLYFNKQMYGVLVLELVYLTISIYGWQSWSFTNEKSLNIRKINAQQFIILLFSGVTLSLLISTILLKLASSSYILIETIAVSTSIIAQALSSRKIINCWHCWFAADAIYIYLMLQQELMFHAILFFIYLFMAILGYYSWRKILRGYELSFNI